VEETGSLFAMSPDRFPLVAFGGGRQSRLKNLDELPSPIDAVTEARKGREQRMRERDYSSEDDMCLDQTSLYTDRRCLVGLHPLEGGDGDGPETRMKRLIDGVPGVPLPWDPPSNAKKGQDRSTADEPLIWVVLGAMCLWVGIIIGRWTN